MSDGLVDAVADDLEPYFGPASIREEAARAILREVADAVEERGESLYDPDDMTYPLDTLESIVVADWLREQAAEEGAENG